MQHLDSGAAKWLMKPRLCLSVHQTQSLMSGLQDKQLRDTAGLGNCRFLPLSLSLGPLLWQCGWSCGTAAGCSLTCVHHGTVLGSCISQWLCAYYHNPQSALPVWKVHCQAWGKVPVASTNRWERLPVIWRCRSHIPRPEPTFFWELHFGWLSDLVKRFLVSEKQ